MKINSKEKLKEIIYIENKEWNNRPFMNKVWLWFTCDFFYLQHKYMVLLRKLEYLFTIRRFRFLRLIYGKQKKKIGLKLNWEIPLFCFGKGLKLCHQNIVINENSNFGEFALFHGNNCVGRKGEKILNPKCATVGDNFEMGYGSSIIGDVVIGNNVVIGANSVVINNIIDNKVVCGTPAKEIL